MRAIASLALAIIACAPTPVAPSRSAEPTALVREPPVVAPSAPPASPPERPLPTPFVDVDERWGCTADDPRITEPSLCSRFLNADLDGDGVRDEIAFWLPGHESHRPLPLLWSVRLKTRTAVATTVTDYPVDGGLIATADIGDGRRVAFVNIGHGASTIWVGLLAFDGRELRMNVTEPMLLIGGSVRHGDALECRSEDGRTQLVHRQVSDYVAEDQWDQVEMVYEWRGTNLALVSVTKSVLTYRGRQPPPNGHYWGMSCGALRLPDDDWAWS